MGLGNWVSRKKELINAGLTLNRAADQWEKDMKTEANPGISIVKGLKAIAGLAAFAGLGGVALFLLEPGVIEAALSAAGVNAAYAAAIVLVLRGAATAWLNYRKHNPPTPSNQNSAPLVILLLLLPAFASAQDPAPTKPAPTYAVRTGGLSVVTTGVKREYFTGRLSLNATLSHRDSILSRVTLTGSQDGGSLDLGNPDTFRSIVPEVEFRRTLSDSISFAILGNVTFSAEGEQGKPIDPRMFTGCAGFRGALRDSTWLQVSGCFAGPVGSKPALGVRGGRSIGDGEIFFDYTLPIQADALKNKAWVLVIGSTVAIAKGEVR